MHHAQPCQIRSRHSSATRAGHPLLPVLAGVVFLSLVAIASLPAARGHSAAFGWMPGWLLGLPLVSALALQLKARVLAMAQRPRMLRMQLAPVRRHAAARPRRPAAPPARDGLRRAA